MLIISTTNVNRDEVAELTDQLERECWKHDTITREEQEAMLQLISYVIDKRVNDTACDLGYTGLLTLKNKLRMS